MAEQHKIARQEFITMGISIYTPTSEEKEYFQDITRPVWQEFSEKIPRKIIKLVQASQEDLQDTSLTSEKQAAIYERNLIAKQYNITRKAFTLEY